MICDLLEMATNCLAYKKRYWECLNKNGKIIKDT